MLVYPENPVYDFFVILCHVTVLLNKLLKLTLANLHLESK